MFRQEVLGLIVLKAKLLYPGGSVMEMFLCKQLVQTIRLSFGGAINQTSGNHPKGLGRGHWSMS